MAAVARDWTGERVGRLTVVEFDGYRPGSRGRLLFWRCRCDCGGETTVSSSNLKGGGTQSCGCLRAENNRQNGMKGYLHGQSVKTPTYRVWLHLRSRCTNPNDTAWRHYGGRGIRVCGRWDSFENFLADMGERPPGTSIDRIDNNGDYEPGNCRWATSAVQHSNKRSNRWVLLDGERLTAKQAALKLGIPPSTLYNRMRKGIETPNLTVLPREDASV